MRSLTKLQKSKLNRWIIEYRAAGKPLYTVDDLDSEHWQELERINDTEILWQEANRYISDCNIISAHSKPF